jgi:hypothetical protein
MASAVRGIIKTHKDRERRRPESEWCVYRDERLRIIDDTLFQRAPG